MSPHMARAQTVAFDAAVLQAEAIEGLKQKTQLRLAQPVPGVVHLHGDAQRAMRVSASLDAQRDSAVRTVVFDAVG